MHKTAGLICDSSVTAIADKPGRTHELNKKYFVIHGSKC